MSENKDKNNQKSFFSCRGEFQLIGGLVDHGIFLNALMDINILETGPFNQKCPLKLPEYTNLSASTPLFLLQKEVP